jgi:hypothetical protein
MRIAVPGALVALGLLLAVGGGLIFAPHFMWKFQTILSAILAFLGGGAAIVAAWLGARALAEQARVNAAALAQQTSDTFAGQAEQEATRMRRQEAALANALAGELKALRDQSEVIRKVLENNVANKEPVQGVLMRELQFGDPLVLRSVADQLGSLEPALAESVVEIGHFVLKWNSERERLAEISAHFRELTPFIAVLRHTEVKLVRTITALERLAADR